MAIHSSADAMIQPRNATSATARIEYLKVRNFRALRDVEFRELTPLTENFLHPRLLPELAEECRAAAARTQLLVTTHSPFFLNALRPEEVRILWRDDAGYTQTRRAADVQGIPEFISEGALLGHLWMEGHLGVGDPLTNQGAPSARGGR